MTHTHTHTKSRSLFFNSGALSPPFPSKKRGAEGRVSLSPLTRLVPERFYQGGGRGCVSSFFSFPVSCFFLLIAAIYLFLFLLPTSAYSLTDSTPPTKPVVTDDGDFTTSTSTLHAVWSSTDPESGIRQYKYAIGTAPGKRNVRTWKRVGLATEVTVTGLSLIPGKTYYFTVKAQNNLRMWSKKGNSNGITVTGDTTSPTGSVLINSDSQYTNSSPVNLSLLAQDNPGGTGMDKMRFSNDNSSWSAWENYSTTKTWGLSAGDGAKTVYAQFKDKAGNASASASDDIILDTTPPVADAGADQTGDIGAEVFFDGSDSSDNYGIASYTWDFGDGSPTANGVNASHTYTSAGEYTVTLSVTDVANNGPVSDIAEVTISDPTTDNHPPVLDPIGNKFFYINVPEPLAQGISPFAGSNLQIEPEIFGSGYKPEPAEVSVFEPSLRGADELSLRANEVSEAISLTSDFTFNKLTKTKITESPLEKGGRGLFSLPATSELRDTLSFAPGWPVATGGAVFSSPAVGNLDDDNDLEIVVGSWDGRVYAFHHTGTPVTGWPVQPAPALSSTHIESSPVICDIDEDGDMEVVVGSADDWDDGYLSIYNHDGTLLSGWPKQVIWAIRSSPALGDIDGNGRKEIVLSTTGDRVYVFNVDGTIVNGWPITINTAMNSSPALSDIDSDGDLEIVIGSWEGKVYAFQGNGALVSGWPRQTASSEIESSPAIGDIDNDGKQEVVIADSRNNWLYALEGDGTDVPNWPVEFHASQTSSPALGDIDGDGDIEIVIGDLDGKVYAFHHNGTPVTGWPVATGGRIESSPALGDIDGDGDIEIVFSSYDGNAYALHHDGTLVSGWPVPTGESANVTLPYPFNSRMPGGCFDGIDCFPLSSSPAIADLDADGDMEISIGSSNNNAYVIEQPGIPVNPFSQEWPKYRGRLKNTGFYPRKDLIFKVSAADEDGDDTLTYSAYILPPGAEFDPQTATFIWIPFPEQIGEYPGVQFEVSDGQDTDSEDITISIMEAP